jgi:hypothetical protein
VTWRRAAAVLLASGAVVLVIGSLLRWVTFEGGVPPTVESPAPVSEGGGWTILASAAVCLLAAGRLWMRTARPLLWGFVALVAMAWAIFATIAITDTTILANVSVHSTGPARYVMLVGASLSAFGALVAVGESVATERRRWSWS